VDSMDCHHSRRHYSQKQPLRGTLAGPRTPEGAAARRTAAAASAAAGPGTRTARRSPVAGRRSLRECNTRAASWFCKCIACARATPVPHHGCFARIKVMNRDDL